MVERLSDEKLKEIEAHSPEETVARAWAILDGMAELWFAGTQYLGLDLPDTFVRIIKQTYAEGLYNGRCSIVDDKDAELLALRGELETMRKALEASRSFVELSYDENGGEEAADAKHVMDQIDAALAKPQADE